MHTIDRKVVPFVPPTHNLSPAAIVSVLTAEPEAQTGAIALCLACQLAQLQQRVLLVDLEASNEVARLCGLGNLAEADKAQMTATSCIAANKPLVPDVRLTFNTVSVMPAGLQGDAATKTLMRLWSCSTDGTVLSSTSLRGLRRQYDFILISAPATHTAYRMQNALADFSLWTVHAALMLYVVIDPFSRGRFLECAQLIRSSRLVSGRCGPCETWILPFDNSVDGTVLAEVQSMTFPYPALQLPPLSYKALVRDLEPYQVQVHGVRERMARMRSLAGRYLDPTARMCLALRE